MSDFNSEEFMKLWDEHMAQASAKMSPHLLAPCRAEIVIDDGKGGVNVCNGYLLPCEKTSGETRYVTSYTIKYWKCSICNREVK